MYPPVADGRVERTWAVPGRPAPRAPVVWLAVVAWMVRELVDAGGAGCPRALMAAAMGTNGSWTS